MLLRYFTDWFITCALTVVTIYFLLPWVSTFTNIQKQIVGGAVPLAIYVIVNAVHIYITLRVRKSQIERYYYER